VTRITGTLHEDQFIFMVLTRSVLLRMSYVSDKSCRANQNTHFMFNYFFRLLLLYEITWKDIVEPDRLKVKIWHMRTACWITKATHTHTHTHSEYVIVIAFARQQWLRERASMLRYTSFACRMLNFWCIK